jgi:hypothetical protein
MQPLQAHQLAAWAVNHERYLQGPAPRRPSFAAK